MAAKLKRVVVAIDSSEQSMNALRWVLDNLTLNSEEEEPGRLVMLHAQSPPSISSGLNPAAIPFGEFSQPEVPAFTAAIEAHQKRISEAITSHAMNICLEKEAKMKYNTVVITGDPKEVICNFALENNADLLVLGSHSYGPIKRMFLGSVSNYCANHAHCPVMVVKATS